MAWALAWCRAPASDPSDSVCTCAKCYCRPCRFMPNLHPPATVRHTCFYGRDPPWVLLSATMAFRLVIPPRPSPCGDHFGAARDQKLRTAEILSNQNVQNFGQIVVPSLGSGTAKLGQRYDRCWKQTTRMYHVMDRGKFQGRHVSGTCSTVVVLRDHLGHRDCAGVYYTGSCT